MKTCKRCGETRALAEFFKHPRTKDKRQPYCKACALEARRERARQHPTKARDYALRYTYGITSDDYAAMLEQQGGTCAICHRPNLNGRPLFVDHCHATGAVRALTCHGCNAALGLMQDSPDRLRAAAAYIELHQTSQRRKID